MIQIQRPEQFTTHLDLIEQELRFISRHSQTIEGAGRSDFEAVDEIGLAVSSALRVLAEYKLSLQSTQDVTSVDVAMAA